MSSAFFEVADTLQTQSVQKTHKLYYDDQGCIIDISYDVLSGNYIEITEDQYSMCYQKRDDYTVVDEKLEFTPPKQRTWALTQQELARNPYVKS